MAYHRIFDANHYISVPEKFSYGDPEAVGGEYVQRLNPLYVRYDRIKWLCYFEVCVTNPKLIVLAGQGMFC